MSRMSPLISPRELDNDFLNNSLVVKGKASHLINPINYPPGSISPAIVENIRHPLNMSPILSPLHSRSPLDQMDKIINFGVKSTPL